MRFELLSPTDRDAALISAAMLAGDDKIKLALLRQREGVKRMLRAVSKKKELTEADLLDPKTEWMPTSPALLESDYDKLFTCRDDEVLAWFSSRVPRALRQGRRGDRKKSADGVLGLSGAYWDAVWDGWVETAFICRYGHQDVHRLLGRSGTLTPLERALFARALQDHWEAEVAPRAAARELGVRSGDD